jgi:hypothetical protein
MARCAGLGILGVLAGCRGEDATSTEPISEQDVGPCVQTGEAFYSPVALADLPPWVTRATGHHEAALVWQRTYSTDSVRGFEARSSISLDLLARSAREFHYVPEPDTGCEAYTQLSVMVELQLATADGALQARFEHEMNLTLDQNDKGVLIMAQAHWMPLDDVAARFELDVDPALGLDPASVERRLRVSLASHEDDGIRGSVQPLLLAPADASGYQPSWSPLEATFPDECATGDALDAAWDELGTTPLALYEDATRRWSTEPITARYTLDGAATGRETQLTLTPGPLIRACGPQSHDAAFIGTLRATTADGVIDIEQEMNAELHRDGSARFSSVSLHTPALDFERRTGVRDVDFGSATHGRVDFLQDLGDDPAYAGTLDVVLTTLTEWRHASFPALSWCSGRSCNR